MVGYLWCHVPSECGRVSLVPCPLWRGKVSRGRVSGGHPRSRVSLVNVPSEGGVSGPMFLLGGEVSKGRYPWGMVSGFGYPRGRVSTG